MKLLVVIILAIHILAYITIGSDLPILRQTIVFIYLTFVPGFILLKFLKLKDTKIVDTICFSIGLSIAFLMFVGFLLNEVFLAVGIFRPLTTIPLEITLSVVTLCLFFVGYRRDLFEGINSWRDNLAGSREAILKSAILLLPVLVSIIGAVSVPFASISIPILSFMIIMVAALFAVALRLIPSKFYPLMIVAISIALAFHVLLISKYIIGADAQLEFQVFRLTINRGYWALLPTSMVQPALLDAVLSYNSMLSVTVLPSIYSALLNINGEVLFKTLYPFVFSLVPLVLYRVYEQQMGRASSLLSTLFLISSPLSFYGVEFLSLNRQIVAVFFLVLSILVLLNKTMAVGKRRILLIVFGAALIVSHYSTAFLYLGLIFLTYVILRITGNNNRVLTGKIVLLLYTIGFLWYAFTLSPLTTLASFLSQLNSRFWGVFNPSPLSPIVFAPHPILTFASVINWALFLSVHSAIFVGILVVMFKLSKKVKLDPTYRILLILSSIILFFSLAVPDVGAALNFSRFYQLSLLFLAPCFVIGGGAFVDSFMSLLRRATRRGFLGNTHKIGTVLACAVLVGYFLSQSGFINFVTQAAPLSYSLDFSRFTTSGDPSFKAQIYSAYIPEQNFFSATWLSKHLPLQSIVYADFDSRLTVLAGYGILSMEYLPLLNTTIPEWNSFVYLSKLNIRDAVITNEPTMGWFNTSEISPILNQSNLIYSNGYGEIWDTPPSR